MTIHPITRDAGSGNWNDAAWSLGHLPGAGDQARFTNAGTTTVQPAPASAATTSGLYINNAAATVIVNGQLIVGASALAQDTYGFDVVSGHLIVDGGSVSAGMFVSSATGLVEIKNGGTYLWQGAGSSQTVDLGTGVNNSFTFTKAFGGTISGFNAGEFITYSGATNGFTIGTNQVTFSTSFGTYVIKLATQGVTYNSTNLTVVGNSIQTTITEAQTIPAGPSPAAVVTNVSSTTSDGSYKVGSTIAITVSFDKTVTVSGAPTLTLETGATDRNAAYSSGSGSSTLTFSYTVQAGDTSSDLNYVSANALALAGGTITSAGNVAAVITLPAPGAAGSLGVNKAIVVDTTAPAAPALALASDSGSSNIDKVTSSPGVTVTGLEGGTTLAEYKVDAAAVWSTDLSALTGALADGAHTINARQTDLAGNTSATASLAFTLDRGAPVAPTLALIADTGSNGSDKVTKSPAITVTGLEGGTTVAEYKFDGAALWSTDLVALTGALADGAHTLSARQTDLAGNGSTVASLSFTLDRGAPVAPTLTLTSDTGSNGADKVTSSPAITVTGLEGGTTVAEYKVGLAGAWTTDLAALVTSLTDGVRTITARQTDLAGNVSSEAALTFTLDRVAPTTSLALAVDSGSNGTDKVTNNAAVNVTGLEGAPTTAEYRVDGGAWVPVLSTAALTSGNHTVEVKQTDLAGNTSAVSSLAFTLDKDAPGALTLALTTDTGRDVTDKVTSNAAITVSGLEGGTTVAEYKVGLAGAWTTDLAALVTSLTDGVRTITAHQTDLAGNLSSETALTFTLDKGIPVQPTLALTTDSGVAGDKISNSAAVTVTGLEGGTTVAEYKIDAAALWSTDLPALTAALADGAHTVTARQTDLAGNESGQASLAFTLDRVAPTATVAFGVQQLGFAGKTSVDISFGENVTAFDLTDLSAVDGTLTDFQVISGSSYKATFNANNGFIGFGSVAVAKTYTDVAGNVGNAFQSSTLQINATFDSGGGSGITPPNNPALNPTDLGKYDGRVAALVVAGFVTGSTPASSEKLASLADFATLQFNAYTAQGVANPGLGPFEALGRGFAETSDFAAKYGAQTESVFIQTSYKSVFGRDATTAQQQHFQDQIDYFETIYEKANLSPVQAETLSKGAVLGQMLGFATLQGPSSQPFLTEANNFILDAADGSVAYGKPLSFWDVI